MSTFSAMEYFSIVVLLLWLTTSTSVVWFWRSDDMPACRHVSKELWQSYLQVLPHNCLLRGCIRLLGSHLSATAACLTLKEPIYNLEHLLCIPREDCLVWAAPDFNLASRLQFPNLSLRLSVRGLRSSCLSASLCKAADLSAGQQWVYLPS